MHRRRVLYGLTANVVLLALVSFLTDVSSEMILPILPFFLTQVLLADAFIVGLIEGLAESVVSLTKVLSGRYSDIVGRRKGLVATGYGLSTAMKVLFPFTASWPQFLGLRVVERMGKGIRDAPRDALLSDSSPAETRGKAFGFHRSMDTAGAIAGPVLALSLLASLGATMTVAEAYRMILLLAAVPAAVSFAVVFLVKEPYREPTPKSPFRLSFRGAPPPLKTFVVIASLFSFAEFSYAFLLLRVSGEPGETTTVAILLYVLFNVVYALHAFPAGVLSDRVGRKPVILVGYAAFGGMAILLAAFPSLPALVLGFLLYGVSYGFAEGTQRALVSDMAPPQVKATVLGAYHTSTGLVKLASGLVAGFLWVSVSPGATFWFGFGVASIAAIGLSLWHPPAGKL